MGYTGGHLIGKFERRYVILELRGLVSKETVVLRRWGSETRKFGLSTELTM